MLEVVGGCDGGGVIVAQPLNANMTAEITRFLLKIKLNQ
jgi:hypothetical protein